MTGVLEMTQVIVETWLTLNLNTHTRKHFVMWHVSTVRSLERKDKNGNKFNLTFPSRLWKVRGGKKVTLDSGASAKNVTKEELQERVMHYLITEQREVLTPGMTLHELY